MLSDSIMLFNLNHNILFKEGFLRVCFIRETKYGKNVLIYKTKLI